MRHGRWKWWLGGVLLAALALPLRSHADQASATADEMRAIAEDAYVYGYPLVLLDVTGKVATNVPAPEGARAPMNQFARVDKLPDASFKDVVMPNVDTLYTSAFLDLSEGPMVVHVPDTHGRYYLMPMLDAYTNVFASPGKRTTGTQAHDFAVVGPGWQGTLPSNVMRIDAPTNRVWVLGRTEIRGKEDLPNVVALTNQYTLTPLAAYGKKYSPPRSHAADPLLDMTTPPPKVVARMTGKEYFGRLARLLKEQPPPAEDREMIARFAKLGLQPGRFSPSPEAQKAIDEAGPRATEKIEAHTADVGKNARGWHIMLNAGTYGTRYLDRATVAMVGLGANLPADAIYPLARLDGSGAPLSGASRYKLHFAKGQEPPVNAFWSLTMYDSSGYFVANPINRYAVGDRDRLVRNADGSIDLLIQHERPEGPMAANWLPAPDGPFQLVLRLYWPKQSVVDGRWTPPAVQKSGAVAKVPRRRM